MKSTCQKYRHLNGEFNRIFASVEKGVTPPPYMVQLFLPFDCKLNCSFCGIHVYRNCKSKGYSRELDYIYRAYYQAVNAPVPAPEELSELAETDEAKLSGMAVEAGIPGDFLERAEALGRAAKMTTAIALPYKVMREMTPWGGLSPAQHRILSSLLVKKTAKVIVREGIDYKLELDHYLRLVDEAAQMGSRVISLGGFNDMFTGLGYLGPLVARIKQRGLGGNLHTSGYSVDPEGIRDLVVKGFDELTVSIHAASNETARRLRGPGDYFDRLDLFIKTLNRAKRELGSPFPKINAVFVLNSLNWQESFDLLKWCEASGITGLNFIPMWLYSHGAGEIKMSPLEEQNFRDSIIKNKEALDSSRVSHNLFDVLEFGQMHVPTIFSDPPGLDEMADWFDKSRPSPERECGSLDRAVCPAPWFQLTIESRGGAKVCANHFLSPLEGNVTGSSLKDIWTGQDMRRVRSDFLQGRLPLECTKYCSAYPSYFIKSLLAEYLRYKRVRARTVRMPDMIGKALLKMGRETKGGFLARRLLPLLRKAGIRLGDPWDN